MCRVISGGKANVLGVDSIRHCEKINHMNTPVIANCCRVTAVRISRPNSIRVLPVGVG